MKKGESVLISVPKFSDKSEESAVLSIPKKIKAKHKEQAKLYPARHSHWHQHFVNAFNFHFFQISFQADILMITNITETTEQVIKRFGVKIRFDVWK